MGRDAEYDRERVKRAAGRGRQDFFFNAVPDEDPAFHSNADLDPSRRISTVWKNSCAPDKTEKGEQ